MLKYIIPLAPVSKKNSQRILVNRKTGKPFVAPSKAYKNFETADTVACDRKGCVLHGDPEEGGLDKSAGSYRRHPGALGHPEGRS